MQNYSKLIFKQTFVKMQFFSVLFFCFSSHSFHGFHAINMNSCIILTRRDAKKASLQVGAVASDESKNRSINL